MNTRTHEVTIRRSQPGDAPALGRLARLDDVLYHGAPALLAEVEGRLVAALPLDGSQPFADPFERTSQLVAMLELRRHQLDSSHAARARGLSGVRRAVRRRHRYRAHASA